MLHPQNNDPMDLIVRARKMLTMDPQQSAAPRGDHTLNQDDPAFAQPIAESKAAAVLVGLIRRPDGPKVLLTQRTMNLRSHSGQIAFPGGKIDPADNGPLGAALRETEEETGLSRNQIEPFGLLEYYYSRTGYKIAPVVAEIHPPLSLTLNHDEAEEAFEAPFDFLMNPANHKQQSIFWQGRERFFYAMPWENRYIWGVTAGVLRLLYEKLFPDDCSAD